MNVIAIDPGYAKRGKGSAVAHFLGGGLVATWFARPEPRTGLHLAPHACQVVVLEIPQWDARSEHKDPRVLMRLTAEGCLLAGLYAGETSARLELLTPSDWKGATPKPVQHAAMWKRLYQAEHIVLGGFKTYEIILSARERGARERWAKPGAAYYPSGWEMHNTLDAVALGATYLGRIGAR